MESSDSPPRSLDLVQETHTTRQPSSLLSPQTPSSVFSKSTLQKTPKGVVKAVVLCYWDNILGPRIRHLWSIQEIDDLITLDVLNYVANHTLSGEICRDADDSRIDSKFYVLKNKGFVVTSFIFTALGRGDLAVHSLSLIVPYKNLHMYVRWQPLTHSWMHRGVATLRVLLEKFPEGEALEKFSNFLSQFLAMFGALQLAPVPSILPLSDTAFHPAHKFEERFVHRSLLYHLVTCGRSVVIGNSPGRINMMIATLAMVLTPEERSRCCYVTMATPDRPQHFYPDVYIQGILLNEGDNTLGQMLHHLYLSEYPTTLVDLISGEVKLTSLPHKHSLLRHDAIGQDLANLWGENSESYPTRNMFRSIEEQESLIANLMQWLRISPPAAEHKESIVDKFVQLLQRKAVVLLQYLKAQSKEAARKAGDVKRLKQELGLTLAGDFNIVLATAERMKPGVYNLVYSDPSAISNPLSAVV